MNPLITSLSAVVPGTPKRCKGGSAKTDHISLLTGLRSRSGFILALFALGSLALCQLAQAVSPAPDGGYPNGNTAEGAQALFTLSTGSYNTAIGVNALFKDTTGSDNTATGANALFSNYAGHDNTATGAFALELNTTGINNTANGVAALYGNTTGINNTANGFNALYSNTTGADNTANGHSALYSNTTSVDNTATGAYALYSNTTGYNNTANGVGALESNTTGGYNVAIGDYALTNNTTGFYNTANGVGALVSNTTGSYNTAIGVNALYSNTTGNYNIALGINAGQNLSTGDNNIDVGNQGVGAESNTIRIGTQGTQTETFMAGISGTGISGTPVKINSSGQLGVAPSSARFKQNIHNMEQASDVLLALRPVTFRYKKEIDPERTPQFGLVAEEVEKVNRDLVVYDAQHKPYTVRYEAVNAMLLNEFLKEHRHVQEQQATIAQLRKEMGTVVARLKEQDSQLQKVSAQIELNRPAPQIVLSNP